MKTNLKPLLVCIALALASSVLLAQERPSQTAKPSSRPIRPANSATTNSAVSDFPIIGHIEKQDCTINIKSGPKETIYSVKSADGKILCNNVSLEQLRAQSPELHEFVKTAVAGNISNGASGDSRLRITDGRVR
jgi:hypothetical protein